MLSYQWRKTFNRLLTMSLAQPLISVTLPNYNYGKFLAQAFESVLVQSYEHFEILFVDDGSTDESVEIAKDFERRDSRIKAVYFEKNQGVLPAHANTWGRVRGEIVYQYSSDDAVHDRDFFRLGVGALHAFPHAGGFFGPAAMISAETGAAMGPLGGATQEGYLSPATFFKGFLRTNVAVPGISSLWKKSAIDELGGYDYRLGPQADYFINHAIPTRYGVVYCQRTMAIARVSEAKTSYSSNTKLEDQMRRIALFEKKLRGVASHLRQTEDEWRVWRAEQARILLVKYGREAVTSLNSGQKTK